MARKKSKSCKEHVEGHLEEQKKDIMEQLGSRNDPPSKT